MEQFTEILREATASITPEYFLLPIHGADAVYRERVYCYELYHQMRRLWPVETPYRLNGEVDKRNHPYFQDGGQPKPDFIVHQPGTGENYSVVEVKATDIAAREITKDLQTLTLFTRRAGYQRPLYLIYGNNAGNDMARIQDCIAELEDVARIEVWLHETPGIAAAPS